MPSSPSLTPCRSLPAAPSSHRRRGRAVRLLCLAGMTMGLVRVAAASPPDMTGAWRAVFDVGGVTDSCQMTIFQTGSSLTMTGSCDGGGSLDLSGTMDAGAFVVSGSGTLLCNDATVTGSFSPDGCSIANAAATCDSGSGTMSATRDGDGDGVCDLTDDCPLVANVDQTDTDHDGLGDACECAGVVCDDDGEPCTVNACDPTTGACTVVADVGAPCSDGNACTTDDACSADGHCGGTPVTCPASDGCHDAGTCDPESGACAPIVKENGSACDDGDACTTTDTCQQGACVGGNAVVCQAADACHEAGTCNPGTGACSTPTAPDGTSCDDGLFCTDGDHCTAGACGGGPRSCADDDACTADACDESQQACTHDADVGRLCEDGVGVCNADATCVVACHTDADCADDGKACTAEHCVSHGAGNVCVHTTDDTRCDDHVDCTRDRCDEDTGACVNAAADTLCDDGSFCDGAETCDALAGCRLGTEPDCSDANDCTDDGCDDTSGACVHSPHFAKKCSDGEGFCNASGQCSECLSDADCDDHLFCNGAETCTNERCRPGTPPSPSDGIPCTADACDEQTDGFTHVPDDGLCDDGKFCTGVEHCDAVHGCQAGSPPALDDGNDCTTDHCDEAHDRVAHDPVPVGTTCHDGQDECSAGGTCLPCLADADCDDGVFCNGAEVCDPERGCQSGEPPVVDDGLDCTHDHCDETTRTVVHAPEDSVCADGNPCTNTVCDAGTGCLTVHLPDGATCGVGIKVGVCASGACSSLCEPMLAATPDVQAGALSLVEAVCPTCPIDEQATYGSHVEYDKCVRSACRALRHRGNITAKQRRRIQLLARRSDVAKKHWEIHVP